MGENTYIIKFEYEGESIKLAEIGTSLKQNEHIFTYIYSANIIRYITKNKDKINLNYLEEYIRKIEYFDEHWLKTIFEPKWKNVLSDVEYKEQIVKHIELTCRLFNSTFDYTTTYIVDKNNNIQSLPL